MATCRTMVGRGGWMIQGMFHDETGERLVMIESDGTFTREEVEHFIEVVKRTAEEGAEESA